MDVGFMLDSFLFQKMNKIGRRLQVWNLLGFYQNEVHQSNSHFSMESGNIYESIVSSSFWGNLCSNKPIGFPGMN